jgi:hypothetical protein
MLPDQELTIITSRQESDHGRAIGDPDHMTDAPVVEITRGDTASRQTGFPKV